MGHWLSFLRPGIYPSPEPIAGRMGLDESIVTALSVNPILTDQQLGVDYPIALLRHYLNEQTQNWDDEIT